jgi:TrmH family RNA methyltransferase
MITSNQNPKVKRVRELLAKRSERDSSAAFVVEGVRLVEEVLASLWSVELVLFSGQLSLRGQKILTDLANTGVDIEEIAAHVMDGLTDTETSQGILAVIQRREIAFPDGGDFFVIADGIRDPGNLGTLIRTCAAAGVDGLILTPGSVDPFAPKVIRAGMGAQFRLPIQTADWNTIASELHSRPEPVRMLLSDVEGGQPAWQANLRTPLALVIGSEAEGVSATARQAADDRIHIPMPGHSESLNAAIAAGILIFEVVRQRDA